jgi:hypothetical protein
MNRIALVTVLALAAIFFAFAAVAKEVGRATEGNMQARLFDEQGDCPDGVQRAELFIDGAKNLDGCWVERDGFVYMLWESGGLATRPSKAFKQTGV